MMRTLAFLLSICFIAVIPAEKIIEIPGIGSLGRMIGVLTMLVWLASVLLAGTIRQLKWFHFLVFAFVLWNAASIFWTIDSSVTFDRIITWIQLALLVVLIWDLYETKASIVLAMQAYVIGALYTAWGTIENYLNASEFVYGRYSAAGQHSVNLGLILALAMSMAWYLFIYKKSSSTVDLFFKTLNIVFLPMAAIALALTGSRGAMLAAAPLLVFMLFTMGKLNVWIRVIVLLVAAVGIYFAISLVPDSTFDRLGSVVGELSGDGTMTGRTAIWQDALRQISQHPALGLGSDAFRLISKSGLVAHNSFLSVWVELGIVGLILFALIFAFAIHRAVSTSGVEQYLMLVLLASWFIGASALTYEHHKTTWVILALIVARSYQTTISGTEPKQPLVSAHPETTTKV